ncbi:MAG: hypothetical protein B7C54_01670 [Acidimicrobiales bacterium mtb01]|nr:glycosyltransferase family 4 protein [Actinomycetota bacterium]TEX47799.1 MAG: hypothetical protein B7C54_01670 [Acidimicrobiales bacterium mtb01]
MPSLGERRRILIDARPINHPTAGQRGIGRYTAGLISGLSAAGADVVAACSSRAECDLVIATVPGIDVRPWKPELVREVVDRDAWYIATQLMLHPMTLDPVPRAVSEARLPVAAVMYDVIPERFPSRYLNHPQSRQLSAVRTMLARSLDGLLAISSFTAETACRELGVPMNRVVSIGAGVGEVFTPSKDDPWPGLRRLVELGVSRRRRLVVAVTGGDQRKNTEALIRAWSLLGERSRRNCQLVVACAVGSSVLARWAETVNESGLALGRDVVFTDSVSDEELVLLHRAATLAVFPSLEEGFGLPVAEAAAVGCPVICSDTSSLPEVIGSEEALFSPYDVRSIARAIEWGIHDEAHRTRLLEAAGRARHEWTWLRTGQRTLHALDHFSSHVDIARRRAIRSKVAICAPPRTSPSAIGSYTANVVDDLVARATADIELFVDLSGTSDRPGSGKWMASAIGRYRHDYEFDHVVCALGSSSHHLSTAFVAESFPTHLWLHEASLAGCYLHAVAHSSSSEWGKAFIERRSELGADFHSLAPEDFQVRGIPLLRAVLAKARSVVVSSVAAAERVVSSSVDCPPVLVLPLAFPDVPGVVTKPIRRVVSIGWLGTNKRLEVLAHVARLAAVDVVFIGPTVPRAVDGLRATARELGVSERISILGQLSEERLHHEILASRVGIQLRADSTGQRSAAVNDLLARGLPVVTNIAEESVGSGLRFADTTGLEDETAAQLVVESVGGLLDDDDEWVASSRSAREVASRWTFADVAEVLEIWLRTHESHERGSIVRAEMIGR